MDKPDQFQISCRFILLSASPTGPSHFSSEFVDSLHDDYSGSCNYAKAADRVALTWIPRKRLRPHDFMVSHGYQALRLKDHQI
ncbi:hypothetical protein F511_01936 [Dorcoceras hygrometricum]|uniref:Uncharacterized protein n=1 Tax=Dorcoceras hygrometricum TaxID=472368 RepID=A0A2Z7AUA5_9LAMI|nr:hypothetical protein F511_01936 [Dorcoceras hygrometricum]